MSRVRRRVDEGVVRRGREGLLAPPRSPKALAAALATILADDDRREAMAASGMERAEEFKAVKELGVHLVQGFFLHRPSRAPAVSLAAARR